MGRFKARNRNDLNGLKLEWNSWNGNWLKDTVQEHNENTIYLGENSSQDVTQFMPVS